MSVDPPEHIAGADRSGPASLERLLAAAEAARADAERIQGLLEEQALELELQATELEVTIDELRTSNEELTLERARAERARAEAERLSQLLDAVLSQLPVGVFVAEAPSGRLILHNRKGDDLLGHSPRASYDKSELARFGVERPDGTPYGPNERPLARALANETVEQEELVCRRPDGSVVELSVTAAPVRDDDGKVIMAVSTFLDVTARRAAEREVVEREALLHGFFSAPGLMMLVMEREMESMNALRRDYRVVLANQEASEWMGASPDTVVGRTGSSFASSPEGADRIAELFETVQATGLPVSVEIPSASRPNSWLRMSVSPIATLPGRPPRLGLLLRDVTEDRLRDEQRHRTQRLVEHATDFIAVSSLALELDYVNPAGLALIGAPSLDVVRGHSALELFKQESRARLENEILPTLRDVGRWSGESLMRQLATDESIPVELTVFVLTDPASGTPLALATIGRPIGERQRLQAELRQSQKMEAVGQLAGGVAHDFNNLLSIILSYSVMVAESMSQSDPARADVEEIRLAGERATALTRQLLAFSRQQVLQPQVVSLNEIVAGMQKMLRRLIGEDIELLVEPANDLGDVLVDPGQIEQVIMNLAVNARDAMPAGGKLTIETANVELDDAFAAGRPGISAGSHIMLAVTDTGEGMDAATMGHIFEPFFTTKEVGKGTGLGLSTVFGIVQQSGGAIRPYSEVGCGTSMKIYLPRTDRVGPKSVLPRRADVSHRGGTETILLVEDEEQVRIVAAAILRRFGYHVLEAQSGGDALIICEQHSATIHLLLSDVIMQRMSGPTLAERLGLVRPEMKVLFMSGYTDRAIINHALLDSNTAFIQKPFTPQRLAQKVRDVLDARRTR
ncbi:MAG: domain S-box-containing protein [Gemmatimonadetes bacterium]|nr:domain S-box-containing protein [Gemmatimonadota bacterium]